MDHPTKFKNQFGNNSEQDRLLNIVQESEVRPSGAHGITMEQIMYNWSENYSKSHQSRETILL